MKNRWEDVKDAFFWVKEDGSMEIYEAIGSSCKWNERYKEHRIARARENKVESHQLFDSTRYMKDSLRTYNAARVAFEKNRSKENQRKVRKEEEDRLRTLKRLHNQEFQRAQERLRELQALYPEVPVSVVEAKREAASDLEKAHESIEKHYQSCVREQERYWKEEEQREAEFRESGTKVRSMEEVTAYLQEVENQLEACSKDLSDTEALALGVRSEAEEEIGYTILSDVANRFEVLCGDAEDMTSRIKEIEMMLRMAELPLLPIKEALAKAFVQCKNCKEKLAKVQPYFEESEAYRSSEDRLQSLDQALQCVYTEYQKASGLELGVRACREQLRERIQEFETQGLDLIKEEILFVTSTYRVKINQDSFGPRVPCMRLYEEYYDDIDKARIRSRWMAMSERLREGVQAYNKMLKEALSEEDKVLKEEEYWLYREERKNKEKRLVGTKIVATQQRIQEFQPIDIVESSNEKVSLIDKARSLFTREDHS
nr:DUF1978 domain-containing protein [Chlamydia pneumoniae]